MATTRVEQLVRAPRAAVYRALVDGGAVQVVEFETGDADVSGEMTIRFLLHASGGDTVVTGIHENLPSGVSPEDNETGWRMSLGKLASFVERAEEDT